MKEQTIMHAVEVTVECPHCNKMQYGFICNPAGGEFECDDCHQPYRVHPEADIEHR